MKTGIAVTICVCFCIFKIIEFGYAASFQSNLEQCKSNFLTAAKKDVLARQSGNSNAKANAETHMAEILSSCPLPQGKAKQITSALNSVNKKQ